MQSKTIKRLLSSLEQFVHSESAGGSSWVPAYFTLGEMKREVLLGELSTSRVTVLAAALGLLGRRISPGVG